ncbi:carbohydrate kinase family protein [Microvirga pudoricolor]|uniref:carbohydrate kinase family protein n=1 Tax=Microvirga pudoricolor TaxID=2778729 RepID=UPI00195004CD|nr:PfkB family carbohydrate kinase [Microvirga pudoricolor]MBM6594391.1 hypothetical protein [Microvirga pudoricolor]
MTGTAGAPILCLGRTYCDIIFTGLRDLPSLGRERFADDVAIAAGGGAYITAAHLAALGRPAILLTRLGTDLLSRGIHEEIQASGVDHAYVEHSEDAGPQPTVALVKDRERAFVSRRAGFSRPSTLERAFASSGAKHLHIAEYATLKDNPDLVALAHAHGLTVSLDPSWDDELIRTGSGFFEACRGIDVFLPNLEEGEALTGERGHAPVLEALQEAFPLTVLKLGAAGARAALGSARHAAAAPAVPVLDTTGAGDAFNAGFLHAWLQTRDIGQGLASGIRSGSLSVQSVGGAPPRRSAPAA